MAGKLESRGFKVDDRAHRGEIWLSITKVIRWKCRLASSNLLVDIGKCNFYSHTCCQFNF